MNFISLLFIHLDLFSDSWPRAEPSYSTLFCLGSLVAGQVGCGSHCQSLSILPSFRPVRNCLDVIFSILLLLGSLYCIAVKSTESDVAEVYIGCEIFVWFKAYLDNVQEYKDDMVDHFYNQWITNFTLSVDTFFVLSATLTAFTWFKKIHKSPAGTAYNTVNFLLYHHQ